jgi:hypothetical protein
MALAVRWLAINSIGGLAMSRQLVVNAPRSDGVPDRGESRPMWRAGQKGRRVAHEKSKQESAAELLADWRAAGREAAGAHTAAQVATLALAAAEAAEEAANEVEAAAAAVHAVALARSAADRARSAAARASEAAQLAMATAEGDLARADQVADQADEAEDAARVRYNRDRGPL